MTKQDIRSMEDIKLLVERFYGRVREDNLLKDIFNERIQDRWDGNIQHSRTDRERSLAVKRRNY